MLCLCKTSILISFPGCKINIGLNIVSKRNDGFHDLQSIFYPVSWSDVLEIHVAKESNLFNYGTSLRISNEENIVWQAFQLLKREYDLPPLEIHLLKNVPNGAGLGGGSANGSATLNLLNQKFNLKIPTEKLLNYSAILGSDCPFFIENKPALVKGRGEILNETNLSLKGFYIQIINPNIHISTQLAFSKITPKKPEFELEELSALDISNWKNYLFNDFEESVFEKYPLIKSIKDEMYEKGALYSSMTGTGSSVYGIFKEKPKSPNSDYSSWIGLLE